MDITPLISSNKLVITHYGDGGFVVGGITYKGNILITSGGVMTPWAVENINDVTSESLQSLFTGDPPEIVLIGTGVRFMPMSPKLRAVFQEKRIASDSMDTGAACRTYTVLLGEGRQVAAALIAV